MNLNCDSYVQLCLIFCMKHFILKITLKTVKFTFNATSTLVKTTLYVEESALKLCVV